MTSEISIDRPHFTVRVDESMLKIDLKGSVRNEIEEALENKPVLRETIGRILEMFIPLHVHLSGIDSVSTDKNGNVLMKLHHHRDVIIPLDRKDAEKLVSKLNELIPMEKHKELERIMREEKLQKAAERREETQIGREAKDTWGH
jgi:hypothetical protein